MASIQSERRHEERIRLLQYLSDCPKESTLQIVAYLGMSNGAAYYLLRALIDKGLVKAKNFARSQRKSEYLYVLTHEGVSHKIGLTKKFLESKRREYKALEAEIKAKECELNDFEISACAQLTGVGSKVALG